MKKNINDFIVEFDNDAIVYNAVSGETHELNLLAVDALRLLTVKLSLAQLAEQIALLYQMPLDAELTYQLKQLIEQFDDLGLVEACCE